MSIEIIKTIREKTGLSLKDIKSAVDHLQTEDEQKIITYLREQGALKAQNRQDRQTGQGLISSYIHEGRIGVLLEMRCETDFVSRGEIFATAAKNICLHIAATQPKFVRGEEADQSFVESELAIAKTQLMEEGKPEAMIEKILAGKKNKILEEVCLLTQPYFKDTSRTVQQILDELSQTTGEKVLITRFTLYTL
jgi:elongation factor Ts